MSGFGITPYGLGGYGGAPTSISIENALALSTHSVLVTLTAEPQVGNGFASGDALNPSTWSVSRLDSGAAFTVLGVARYAPRRYVIVLLEEFGSVHVSHRVRTQTLRAINGLIITAPYSFDFVGVTESLDPVDMTGFRRFQVRDLANPPFSARTSGIAGTLVINSGGDYESESGVQLKRKLIIRRLITRKRGFFHLDDSYGLGLAEKEPIPSGDLMRLRKEIELQAQLEEGVEGARAQLTMTRSGVLTIRLGVNILGQAVDIGLQIDGGSVTTF